MTIFIYVKALISYTYLHFGAPSVTDDILSLLFQLLLCANKRYRDISECEFGAKKK